MLGIVSKINFKQMKKSENKIPYLKDIKPGINKIEKYISGEIKKKIEAKLSSNESPFEIPKKIIDAIFKELRFSNKYPDGDSDILKSSIAKSV